MNNRIRLNFDLDPDNGRIGVFQVRDYVDTVNFVVLARYSCNVDDPAGIAKAWKKAENCAQHHRDRLAAFRFAPNFKEMQTVAALLGYKPTEE
jgi:hypothetical protein